jgi:hypothetical protein
MQRDTMPSLIPAGEIHYLQDEPIPSAPHTPKLVTVCELWEVGPLVRHCGHWVRESFCFGDYR